MRGTQAASAPSPCAAGLLSSAHLGHSHFPLARLPKKGEEWGDLRGMSPIQQEWTWPPVCPTPAVTSRYFLSAFYFKRPVCA